jgi:hypothetical protein
MKERAIKRKNISGDREKRKSIKNKKETERKGDKVRKRDGNIRRIERWEIWTNGGREKGR